MAPEGSLSRHCVNSCFLNYVKLTGHFRSMKFQCCYYIVLKASFFSFIVQFHFVAYIRALH